MVKFMQIHVLNLIKQSQLFHCLEWGYFIPEMEGDWVIFNQTGMSLHCRANKCFDVHVDEYGNDYIVFKTEQCTYNLYPVVQHNVKLKVENYVSPDL